jgi:ParB-like chromosome segregation protein Spo0J
MLTNPEISIYTSTDYDRFVPDAFSRKISKSHVMALGRSMREYGFAPHFPVLVKSEVGKLTVLDGNHRVAAARIAGVPILFLIACDHRDAALIQAGLHPGELKGGRNGGG